MKTASGEVLSYHALRPDEAKWVPFSGRWTRIAKAMSVAGYVSCPDFQPKQDHAAIAAGLDEVYRTSKPGFTPVMSQEAWYCRAHIFQKHLPHWFEPSETSPLIDVVAFVRPPVDWLNAAFWQWGAWNRQPVETWMAKTNFSFRIGEALSQWAALPNVNLRLHFGGDVMSQFETEFGVNLDRPESVNSAQSPAMIGFMMRNPQFRSSGHDIEAEFVVQRWCPPVGTDRPWALTPRHIAQLEGILDDDLDRLFALAPERAAIATKDPRWRSYLPYLDIMERGPSHLSSTSDLEELFASVCIGLGKAMGCAPSDLDGLPEAPKQSDPISRWDEAISEVLTRLIEVDRKLRHSGMLKRLKSLSGTLPFKR